jgi:hypothetical protein
MDSIELLVHVNAKTRKQDDQRYLALAQSIIDYEPAILMQGLDEDQEDSIRSQDLSQIIPTSSLSFELGANNSPTPGPRETLEDLQQAKQTKFVELPPVIQRTRRTSSNYNPPYKNPFHGVRPGQYPKSAFETPDKSRRPRTAPEQSTNTVQVPASRTALRRVQSESASFDSLSSHVSDSQPNAPSFVKGSSPGSLRGGLAADQSRGLVRSHSQASLDIVNGKFKRRKIEDTRELVVTNIPRPAGTKAFLLTDKMDWTSSPPASSSSHASSSLATTATASQPVQANIVEETVHVSPPIIIISSDSSRQTDRGQSKSQASGPEASEPTTSQMPPPSVQTSSQESRHPLYRSVFETHGLKTEIAAPEPPVGQGRFTTHLTKALEDFARELPFTRFFRPVEVTRDVKVLERGYWDMEVTIVDDTVAEEARAAELVAPTVADMQKRFLGKTAMERLAQYEEAKRNGELDQLGRSAELRAQGLWTEEEVVSFWQNFSSFIEKGKAGWGCRMVGEEVSDDRSGVERKVRIRIFTWGELLGHMYLAAWVFSDKVAARVPMRWIAGDGSCVVEMAGTRSGRGTLPEWNRKGQAGERGCWGVG